MMSQRGSVLHHIQAEIIGGGENFHAINYLPDLGRSNIVAARDILSYKAISINGESVGGGIGRRIVFHTKTGEIAVQKAPQIRESDWYPPLSLVAAQRS